MTADTQDRDRTRALHKIQKLLRLAKDGRGNVTEAETALRQAQALMAKFNIDDAEATAKDIHNNPDAIIKAWCKAGFHVHAAQRRIPRWGNVLAFGVATLYKCRVAIQRVGDKGLMIMFGGYHTDVQVACWTYDYLMDCIRRASEDFEQLILTGTAEQQQAVGLDPVAVQRLESAHSRTRMNRFRMGMATELQNRLYALAEERATAQSQHVASKALVVTKASALDAHFGKERIKVLNRRLSMEEALAQHAGVSAASKVRLEPNPIGNKAQAPLQLGRAS